MRTSTDIVQDGKSYPSCGLRYNTDHHPGDYDLCPGSARVCNRVPGFREACNRSPSYRSNPFLVYACFIASGFPYNPVFSIIVRLVRSRARLAVCRKSSENLNQRTPEDPVAMDVFFEGPLPLLEEPIGKAS